MEREAGNKYATELKDEEIVGIAKSNGLLNRM